MSDDDKPNPVKALAAGTKRKPSSAPNLEDLMARGRMAGFDQPVGSPRPLDVQGDTPGGASATVEPTPAASGPIATDPTSADVPAVPTTPPKPELRRSEVASEVAAEPAREAALLRAKRSRRPSKADAKVEAAEEQVFVSFRAPISLRDRLKHQAIRDRVTVQELLVRMISAAVK